MRSPSHPDERDLDVTALRRSPPRMASVKTAGHGQPRRGGIRRYVIGGFVALVLALFTGVIWFAYQELLPGGDEPPPVIRADASPLKREPVERGGLPLVNEESAVVRALDEPDAPVRVERIVPRTATPPRSTADILPEALEAEPLTNSDQRVAAAAPGLMAGSAPDASAAPAADDPADALDALLRDVVQGRQIAAVEPAAGATEEPLPAALAASDEPARGAALRASPSLPTGTGSEQPPTTVAAVAPSPPPATPAPESVAPAPAATPSPAPSPVPTTAETTEEAPPPPALAESFAGAFAVQLLASRDEAAVAAAWAGLQQQHPTVLGPLRSRVQRAEIGGNTFYRLQAGPFVDRAGANAVCSALQSRGADCFIIGPSS